MFLFGKKALIDNLDNKNIISINIFKNNKDIIKLLKEKKLKFKIHNDLKFFSQFDKNLNHQGIVVVLNDEKNKSLDTFLKQQIEKSVVVIIDSIEDPHNFGAILRTCDFFKVDAVVYKKNNQVQINDFVSKTSMGAISHLNLFKVSNLNNVISILKNNHYWIYATNICDNSMSYHKVKYDKKVAIIFGNENKGVSPLLLQNADFNVQIPKRGNVQSLNVSVSVGIILSEINKQLF